MLLNVAWKVSLSLLYHFQVSRVVYLIAITGSQVVNICCV